MRRKVKPFILCMILNFLYGFRGMFPITHSAEMKGGSKAVSALEIDPSGARMVSGTHDYLVKYWDFNGMDQNLQSFRTLEPFESLSTREIRYSKTGDRILIVSSHWQPKLFNRDGLERAQYVRGDRYLRDLKNTTGHTAAINTVQWHPNDSNLFMTSSVDSTVRIWDVNVKDANRQVIVIRADTQNKRCSVFARYNPDAKFIVAGCQDGSIRTYSTTGATHRPLKELKSAHGSSVDVTSLEVFSEFKIASRLSDGGLKTFDLRNLKKELASISGLDTFYDETNLQLSPDEKTIVTGTSVRKGMGKLVFLDSETLQIKKELPVGECSVLRVLWHPKLNQIVTGNSDGSIKIFYDLENSSKGVLQCVSRHFKVKEELVVGTEGQVYNPNALPLYKTEEPKSRTHKRKLLRQDPLKSHLPTVPHVVVEGGRVGAGVSEFYLKGIQAGNVRDVDPREAILKFAEKAEQDPKFVTPTYSKTQPKPIFDDKEIDEPEMKRRA